MKKGVLACIMGLWMCFGWVCVVWGADQGPISSAVTETGTFSSPGFSDSWTFEGQAGDWVVITAAEISGYVHPEIYLYAPGGGQACPAATGLADDHRLECELQDSGTYTIIVKDYGLDDSGDYGIALAKIPGAATSAVDPDGGPIASSATMTGNLTNHADTDIYQFYGEVGEWVVITAAEISGYVHPEIYLYPPDGGPSEASAVGLADDHRLEHELQSSGLYTIIINDYSLDDDGAYGIALAKIPGPCSSPTDPDGACPIVSGFDATGTLADYADTDLYQFYGETGEEVLIDVAEISGYVHPEIYLYPPGGGTAEDSATGLSSSHSLDHVLLQSGLYTILISDYSLDDNGDYGISFTKIPATVRPGVYNPSPANGASINNLSGSLSWGAVTGATGYDVYFGENFTTFLQQIGTNISSPSIAFPTMEWNKVYYWHVVAHTASGDIQGSYWWFTTDEPVSSYLLWTK